MYIILYGLCMGFGVHTALINFHPVSGSVEDQARSSDGGIGTAL